jgi:peptide/nickel transport system permease protein
MLKFLAKRLAATVVVIGLISVSVFLIFAFLPSDPAALTCGKACNPVVIAANRHRLGLDVPVPVQYGRFVKGLFVPRTPGFGYSFNRHECVTQLIVEAFPVTFSLAIGSFILWMLLGISLGIVAAKKQGKWQDKFATGFVVAGVSLPVFVTALLTFILGIKLRLINPIDMGRWVSPFSDPLGWLKTYYLPWIVLALFSSAAYTRFTRSNVIETSSEDYVRTARAKGLSEKVILRKHILRAALAPLLTIAGIDFAVLLGGAIFTETIFNLPGLGRLSIKAVLVDYDLPVILATTMLAATFVVVMNLVVDVMYAYLDPRVRVG